jgi:hypothetical protein
LKTLKRSRNTSEGDIDTYHRVMVWGCGLWVTGHGLGGGESPACHYGGLGSIPGRVLCGICGGRCGTPCQFHSTSASYSPS